MALKLGRAKREDKLNVKDLKASPIWMRPYEGSYSMLRPVLERDPDVNREIYANCVFPTLAFPLTLEPLCRIVGKRDVRFVLKKPSDRTAARVGR
jgi:hypothetical protein